MSQEILSKRKKMPGRPPGSPNKNNIRMRDRFEAAGFDYVNEVTRTISEVLDPVSKLDALVRLAPYFMQRLREESEDTPVPQLTVPIQINTTNATNKKDTRELMTELLAHVLGKTIIERPE